MLDYTNAPVPSATTKLIWANHDDEDRTPFLLGDVIDELQTLTGGELRALNGQLVVRDGDRPYMMSDLSDLVAWLSTRGIETKWRENGTCPKRRDAFKLALRRAQEIDGVMIAPHFPPLPRQLYCCDPVAPQANGALDAFLSCFCPATSIDRELLRALVVTTYWGSEPGTRPFFVITADGAGIQVGKSVLTEILAELRGETLIDFGTKEEKDEVTKRLLSPGSAQSTLCRFDNVKSNLLTSEWLEAIVTAANISGRQLYVGEGNRHNNLTWLATLNEPCLSGDLASRGIVITLTRPPTYDPHWLTAIRRFCQTQRRDVWADVAAFLATTPKPIPDHNVRWGKWVGDVVARLDDPTAVLAHIAQVRQTVDADATHGGDFEELLLDRYLPEQTMALRVQLTSQQVAEVYNLAMGTRKGVILIGRDLTRWAARGHLRRLVKVGKRYWLARDPLIHRAAGRLNPRAAPDSEAVATFVTALAAGDAEAVAFLRATGSHGPTDAIEAAQVVGGLRARLCGLAR